MATLPSKQMSFEPADGARFRRALGSLAAGVNVITVLDPDGVARGMSAARRPWFSESGRWLYGLLSNHTQSPSNKTVEAP